MTTSTDTVQPGQQPLPSGNSKSLWAAVGILGMTVVAMGGTLLYKQRASTPPATVAALATTTTAPPQYPTARQTTAPAADAADDLVEKPAAAAVKPVPLPLIAPAHVSAPAPVHAPVKHVNAPAHAPAPALHYSSVSPAYSAPTAVAAAPRCAVCGTVESVTPVERSAKGAGPGLGTVAGGVLGAVLGNQVGHGNGRAAATILGAVGGGFAGNAIEGKMRRQTVYEVGVRMQDGSRRTVEAAQAPQIGGRVTVEGSTLRADDGVSYSPQPAPAAVQSSIPFDYQQGR